MSAELNILRYVTRWTDREHYVASDKISSERRCISTVGEMGALHIIDSTLERR